MRLLKMRTMRSPIGACALCPQIASWVKIREILSIKWPLFGLRQFVKTAVWLPIGFPGAPYYRQEFGLFGRWLPLWVSVPFHMWPGHWPHGQPIPSPETKALLVTMQGILAEFPCCDLTSINISHLILHYSLVKVLEPEASRQLPLNLEKLMQHASLLAVIEMS